MAEGGAVRGPRPGGDSVPAWLSDGFDDGGVGVVPLVSVTVAELAEGVVSSVQSHGGVGAQLTCATVCTECGQRVQKGDVLTANLAPAMSGSWRHTDCSDPKLERSDG